MATVKVQELSLEAFQPYGTYSGLINPKKEKLGEPPIEFFRDMIQQDVCGSASYSTCRVEKRDFVIDISEYHTATTEGILPIDNDILIHVGPATSNNGIPLEKIEVFRIPRGTMVVLRPGIWHHAPFTVNDDPANVLIVLPERTYANDCEVVEHKENEKINIEF